MVDFGGWDMPVNYGSQIDEHHAVRNDAGMFDVSHMRAVDLRGAGARDFLRYALANNVDKLKEPGKALYSCLLRPDGGVIDDLIVYFLADDWFRIVVNASTTEKDVAWLRKLLAERAPQLSLAPRDDLAMIAVQGPQARAKVWQAVPGSEPASANLKPFQGAQATTPFGEVFVARTGYTGEDGFEIIVPEDDAPQLWKRLEHAGVKPAGLGARDTLRLEAGMNLYGQDMDETVTPWESGLAWTVSLDEGRDFIGRKALEKQKADGVKRVLVGLIMDEKGVLRHGQRVVTPAGDGEILSGGFSPTIGKSIAFARVPAGAGEALEADIRGRLVPVRVVKYPFVRDGQPMATV